MDFDVWPSYILQNLFCGMSYRKSVRLLRNRASNIMRLHYVLWHSLKYMRHQAVYYNVAFKKLMWLNGRGLDQMEFVVPMVSNTPRGIDGTGLAFDIHLKLFSLRDAQMVFPY